MSELLDMITVNPARYMKQELTQPQEWDSSHRSFLQLRTKK